MANSTENTASKKKARQEQMALQVSAPAGFTAPSTPPNRSEQVAQWNVYSINQSL